MKQIFIVNCQAQLAWKLKNLFDSCFLKNLKIFVNKCCSELSGPLQCYKIWKSFKISTSLKFTSFHRKSVISRYSIKYTELKINLFSGLLALFQCLFPWLWTSNCFLGSERNTISLTAKYQNIQILAKVVICIILNYLFSFFWQ